MGRLASLNARLVVTVAVLVAVVAVLIGVATTVAMRDYLTGQVDDQARGALARATGGSGLGPPLAGDSELGRFGNQAPGTLIGLVEPTGATDPWAVVLGPGSQGEDRALSGEDVDVIGREAGTGRLDQPHTVRIDDGEYRMLATDVTYRSGADTGNGVLVVGISLDQVNDAVSSLIAWEALFWLLGTTAAVAVGGALVRRQLQPLREVAQTAHRVSTLPLAAGGIRIEERVPDRLTDEATEVGQVGGALNRLLEHVDLALDARQRSESRVRQFVADASHELRTPLATIKGYAELARRHPDDTATAVVALDKVEQESGRMTDLVEDLLLLARLDSGRPLERTGVDLTRLLVQAVSDARVIAPDHHWRLSLPEQPIEVPGDAGRLHQVVTNLLANARHYTPPGSTVTVSALLEPTADGAALVSVHDDGPGFPHDLVEHAFERFTRGDAARHRAGGAGLGLSLVQAIVSAHGGAVRLTSRPGDTTITIRLPR